MFNRIPLIFNPSAHANKGSQLAEEITKVSTNIELIETKSFDHLKELVEGCVTDGIENICVAGGDGTINAVIDSILGTEINLGVFPTGTMNLFAREMGLPLNNIKDCWKVIDNGKTKKIDIFKAGDSIFVQVAGVGFDAKIIKETSWENKKRFGRFSYLLSAFNVASQEAPRIRVESADGGFVEGAFVLIGNGALYGPALKVFSNAKNDDGLLDVMVFDKQNPAEIIKYVSSIALGVGDKAKGIKYFQSKEIHVQSESPVPIEVDGELAGMTPISFKHSGRRVSVFAP
ncbi:MAG: diacylglycerol kinase [Verrucomicrobiales bacterium]|nr:diacylglycerol kinase [Verrucomicrobiales bacterium]